MIQIDMFEVQLGAALLIQFKTDDGQVVRILADAGVKAGGYKEDHVHKKLPEAFSSFAETEDKRLDLIIGTHYDEDHLVGLVPIILDKSIEIGEIWLPPVANDSELHAAEDLVEPDKLLAHQFYADDGEQKLRLYLEYKADACERFRTEELKAQELIQSSKNFTARPMVISETLKDDWRKEKEADLDAARRYFEGHRDEALSVIGESDEDSWNLHIDASEFSGEKSIVEGKTGISETELIGSENALADWWKKYPFLTEPQSVSLAHARRNAATDAINAASLKRVVAAMKRRGIKPQTKHIPVGNPSRYVWRASKKRFNPGERLTADGGLELLLLGPSRDLIKRHWDKLPPEYILQYVAKSRLPLVGLTPSNQLSYIVRLEVEGQSLLVTGDSGCADFKPYRTRKPYYPALLKPLLPLHVIQIAHHGGGNGHFYRVLEDAGYPNQTDRSFLLLSHRTDDKFRPNAAFGEFVSVARKPADDFSLLFTSRPRREKVLDYAEIIHPAVGQVADRGDVRLVHDGRVWRVEKHAIEL